MRGFELLKTPRSVGHLAVVGFVLAAMACQEYPFLYRPNQRVAATKVREILVRDTDTDILFIIDNSGSMREEQDNLIRNSTAFVEVLAQSENLYRLGVITTDFLDEGAVNQDAGRLRMVPASQTQLNNAGCGIGPSNPSLYLVRPDPSASDVNAQRCRLVEDFRATVASLGIAGSGTEAGLAAARAVFDPAGAAAGYNGDFHRADADLALIFLTDEDDCSLTRYINPPRPNSYCYRDAVQDLIPIADYVSYFGSLKGNADVRKVRAALIAGGTLEGESGTDFVARGCRLENDGSVSGACGCWTSTDDGFFCDYLTGYGHRCSDTSGCLGPPGDPGNFCKSTPTAGTCDTPRCDALPGSRYDDFLTELARQRNALGFSAGVYADTICQAEYDDTLRRIAGTIVLTDCFPLEEPPLDAQSVLMVKRVTDIDGNYTEEVVPRFDATGGGDCQTCGGNCAAGAWEFDDETLQRVCLECGLKKDPGVEFFLTVLNEVKGVTR